MVNAPAAGLRVVGAVLAPRVALSLPLAPVVAIPAGPLPAAVPVGNTHTHTQRGREVRFAFLVAAFSHH